MINIFSSDQSILVNKTSDCSYDLQTASSSGQPLSLIKIDSNTITLFGTGLPTSPLKADVRLSAQTGNAVIANSDGLYVATPVIPAADYQTLSYNTGNGNLSISNGNTVNIPFQQLSFDCGSKILQITGSTPVDLSCLSQSFVETSLTAIDSNTLDFTATGISNHTITADVRIDGSQPNALSSNSNGLYVAPPAAFTETPLTVNDTSTIDLTATGTSNHTLSASVKLSAASDNILAVHLDGLYVPTPDVANTYTFNNGLTNTTGVVGLGGSLVQPTTITTGNNFFNLDTGAGLGGFRMNNTSSTGSYMALNNGSDGRTNIIASVLRTPLVQGTSTSATSILASTILNNSSNIVHGSTNAIYPGAYGELGIDITTNTMQFGTGVGKTYAGIVGVFTIFSSGNITGGMPSGGTFYANVGGTTNIQNLAAIRTFGGVQTPNTTAYSGTITNYYGVYLEPLSVPGTGVIANKFGIYQAGASDVNRFFGDVQNAGGTVQFTSDIRVKENFKNFTRGLEDVKKLITHTFNYTYKKDRVVTGLIAQELEQVIPEAVSRGNFTTPEGVDYDDFRFIDQNVLFYTLINAIKELTAKVELLEKKI